MSPISIILNLVVPQNLGGSGKFETQLDGLGEDGKYPNQFINKNPQYSDIAGFLIWA